MECSFYYEVQTDIDLINAKTSCNKQIDKLLNQQISDSNSSTRTVI